MINECLQNSNMSPHEIITAIVAITALLFSGWQLLVQRGHNKLSVKPLLVLEHQWKDGIRMIFLKNVGLGPAIVNRHDLKYLNTIVPFEISYHLEELASDLLGG